MVEFLIPANGANMTQDANGDFYVQGNGEKIGGTEVLATKFKVRLSQQITIA